jgi:hypothetical protein
MGYDMVVQDRISQIDQQVSEAVHELVVASEVDREQHSRKIGALLSERVKLARPPVFDRIEKRLRIRS